MPDPSTDSSSVKAGYLTTEFYLTLFTQVVAAVVAIGAIFGLHLDSPAVQAAIPVVAVLAATIAQIFYTRGRSEVKAAVVSAVAAPGGGAAPGGNGRVGGAAIPPISRPDTGIPTSTPPLSAVDSPEQTTEQLLEGISADLRQIFLRIQTFRTPA